MNQSRLLPESIENKIENSSPITLEESLEESLKENKGNREECMGIPKDSLKIVKESQRIL